MSPRAASRLESIGFEQVNDYIAGKADWGKRGAFRSKAQRESETCAGAHARTDVPTCKPHDRLHEVCESLDESGWDTCFVVEERRVVLGRLGRRAIRGREDVPRAGDDARTKHGRALASATSWNGWTGRN